MANRFLNNVTINDSYTLPSADGTENQIIVTDGAGNLSFNDLGTITGAITGVESNLIYYEVKNSSGAQILKGKGVMAVGTDGNSGHILIDEMVADGSVEARYFLGVLSENLDNGSIGRVIAFGELDQFNTLGQNGETWTNGQVLWCDPDSAGDFTITEPDGPNLKIPAAFIMKAATNGKIQIRVQGHEGIKDLYDTKITTQADGELLVWNNTLGVWQNDGTATIDYTNGRVGIGAIDPLRKLHVVGDFAVNATTNQYYGVYINGVGEGADPSILIGDWHNASATLKWDSSARSLNIDTQYSTGAGTFNITGNDGASTFLTVNTSGNVGIGTTSAAVKLSVSGTVYASGGSAWNGGGTEADKTDAGLIIDEGDYIYTRDASTYLRKLIGKGTDDYINIGESGTSLIDGIRFYSGTTGGQFRWFNDTSEIMRLNNTGLGIGTTSPFTTGGTAKLTIAADSAISWGASNTDMSYFRRVGAGEFQWQTYNSGNTGEIHLQPYGGNVGIGTTSPSYKLDISGGNIRVGSNSPLIDFTDQNNADKSWRINANGGDDKLYFQSYNDAFSSGSTRLAIVHSSGSVLVNTTSSAMTGIGGAADIAQFKSNGSLGHIAISDSGNILEFSRNSTNYIVSSGTSSSLAFDIGGTERMRINSSGNVGIGTTSPSAKLHVYTQTGNTTMVVGRGAGQSSIKASADADGGYLALDSVSNAVIINHYSSDNVWLVTGGGNVGIGTTSPGDKLDVAGNIKAQYDGSNYSRVGQNSSGGYLQAYSGAIEKIMLRSYGDSFINGGNVGIGTTSPGAKLEIHKDQAYGQYGPVPSQLNLVNTNTEGTAGFLTLSAYYNNTGNTYYHVGGIGGGKETTVGDGAWGGYLSFYTTSDGTAGAASGMFEHMRITADGNVGIGVTNPSSKLEVSGTTQLLTLRTTYDSDSSQRGAILWKDATNITGAIDTRYNGTTVDMHFGSLYNSGYNTTSRMVIKGNGNVGINTTSSDSKLQIVNPNGGSYRFGYGGSSDVYLDADTVYFRTDNGGSNLMTSTTNGLGIGVVSPTQKLHVGGNIRVTGAYYDSNNSAGTSGQVLSSTATGTNWITLNDIYYTETEADARFVNVTGDTMTGDLTLNNSGSGNLFGYDQYHYIKLRDGGANWITLGDYGGIRFFTGNNSTILTEKVQIAPNGNVGIGTTSPTGKLNVNEENGVSTVIISRGGANLTTGTALGNIIFPADYNGTPTDYASINAYANALSSVRGSLDFKVKSTSGNLLTGMTVYGTNAGINVGIGTTTPSEKLDVAGNIKHTGLTMTDGTDVDQLKTFSMTYQLSADTWTDTGINSGDLSTGTYVMQVYADDHNAGGQQYDEYYSATISWFGAATNSSVVDEIVVHRAGHAPNTNDLQFRTVRHPSGGDNLMLQVKANLAHTATMNGTDGRTHTYKFRRLI